MPRCFRIFGFFCRRMQHARHARREPSLHFHLRMKTPGTGSYLPLLCLLAFIMPQVSLAHIQPEAHLHAEAVLATLILLPLGLLARRASRARARLSDENRKDLSE